MHILDWKCNKIAFLVQNIPKKPKMFPKFLPSCDFRHSDNNNNKMLVEVKIKRSTIITAGDKLAHARREMAQQVAFHRQRVVSYIMAELHK